MKGTVYILVNGILTFPGQSKNWNERGEDWININVNDSCGVALEYFTGPLLSRVIGQRYRAKRLIEKIIRYTQFDIVLVGHSNGADVIHDALNILQWPKIVSRICLFSAAIDSDMVKNGFDSSLAKGNIKEMRIFVAGNDKALAIGGSIGKLFGYGKLGLEGPKNLSEEAKLRTIVYTEPDFGHSD